MDKTHDAGESTGRRGEETQKKHEGKEAGRHDQGTKGTSDRPGGKSTPRDQTSSNPSKREQH